MSSVTSRYCMRLFIFFFQAEDGIRDGHVTGVQTCALPISLNVWMRILPAQRGMIAAAAAGEKFDASLGAQAKLRSKHNTFMAVPVVFLMLSNHFPVATYGNRYGWQILLALVVAGWVAAKLIRES